MIQHFTIGTSVNGRAKKTACGRNNRHFTLVSTENKDDVDCGSCKRWLAKRPAIIEEKPAEVVDTKGMANELSEMADRIREMRRELGNSSDNDGEWMALGEIMKSMWTAEDALRTK